MKKLLCIMVLITISIVSGFAIEQHYSNKGGYQLQRVQDSKNIATDEKTYSQAITTPVLAPITAALLSGGGLLSRIGLAYERKVGKAISIQPSGAYYISPFDYLYEIGFDLRWYYFGKALEGAYLAPSIEFIHGKATAGSISVTVMLLGGTLKAGYQWIWGGFTLDTFAGIGYPYKIAGPNINTGGGLPLGKFRFRYGLSLGFAW